MQSIKRNRKIKLILKGKATSVSHFESKIPQRGATRDRQSKVPLGEPDHVVRRIDAHCRTPRYARCNFCGNLALAAADIEDPL